MIFNENGEILNNNFILMNESYKLDLVINEGFSDMMNKVKSTAVKLVRKMIDAVQTAIEYFSRLKFRNKIKDFKKGGNYTTGGKMPEAEVQKLFQYYDADGFGKWEQNFYKACNYITDNINEISGKDPTSIINKILNILYEDKNGNFKQETFFKSSKTNISYDVNTHENFLKALSAVTFLDDISKDMRKTYSKLIVLNTELSKGMKIDSTIIKLIHSYLIDGLQSYRDVSNIVLKWYNRQDVKGATEEVD